MAHGVHHRTQLALVVVLALVATLFLGATPSWASTDIYVDKTSPTCSDAGTGTSSAPFCTVVKGVSRLAAGSTLYIGNGTYPESIQPLVSGTAAAPITITAWPGRTPVVGTGVTYGAYLSARSYVTVSSLTFTATTSDGIYVTGSDHVTISGNTVTYAGEQAPSLTARGISLRSTTASVVTDNNTNHNTDSGIYLRDASTGITIRNNQSSHNAQGWQRGANGINVTSPGNTVIGNVVHDNDDSGIQFYPGANNSLATLNLTYNNGDHGIDNLNVTGGRIIGNTVYRNCTSGINVEGTSGNYLVANNVAVDNAVYAAYGGVACSRRTGNIGIFDSAPASTTVDHNLVHLTTSGTMYTFGTSYSSLAAMQAATGQEQHGVQSDPRFANLSGGDFQLTAGSAAIDRGDSGVPGEQSVDLLGNPRVDDPSVPNSFAEGTRPYDDLGAYEFQPGSAPPPQPPTARLSVTPTTGTTPLAVTANASTSTDPQGQPLTYAFNFGDGTTVPAGTAATATHSYTTAGTFTITVTVTNTSALTSTATATASPAQAPTARLSVTPTTGTTPLAVTANASTSTDPQGQPLTYAFNFGDGTTTPAGTSATATHTYTTAGTFTITVTVTNTSALTSTATATVSVAAAQAPTARLSVTPSTGTAPLAVTADATASTDPQGQTLTYAVNFGDGTTTPAGTSATATHTYTTAGTFTITVTVTNAAALTSTANATVTVAPTPPGYVAQLGTSSASKSRSSGFVTVTPTAGVRAGDLVVVTLQLADTSAGTVSVRDVVGNTYTVVKDISNSSGRLVILSGVAVTALAPTQKITATFPKSGSYRMVADELTGVTKLDQSAAQAGTGSSFSSGTTPTTTAEREVVFGAVALFGATGSPTWASGWTGLPSFAGGTNYLGRAYQLPIATDAFTASGAGSGNWLAASVTFKP